ncbi:hypothetical protein M9Y10_020490 [Tritrichomonas musculus]|uniref:Guanosine-3',5'-bis(diphosphate) 3'-pyrophosphohydrolase MESH1 n=1 Tax=Tritrichomonas musculus TaxID=1915356 RepID=A0ABR2HIK1_9EUKA
MWSSEIVNKALFFANAHHKGQTMKNPPDMPYSSHFVGVCLTAINYAQLMKDEINWELLVCCALLHDTIEDTDATYEEVKENFGQAIADGVLALTKDEKVEQSQQMADSLSRIKKQPKEVAIVKLSDRMFNLRDKVPSWSPEKIKSYQKEGQLICDALGDVFPKMKSDLQNIIDHYLD